MTGTPVLETRALTKNRGVDVHTEVLKGHPEVEILRFAERSNIDLIVMGAYGHSRWTERVLGGATRGILASMTVPVLMSH